jgi:hypothetical protein
MDRQKKQINRKTNPIYMFGAAFVAIIAINLLFIMLFQSEVRTYKLLNEEKKTLDQDQMIITASADILGKYQNEIDVISGVFPNEETFLLFVQTFENTVKRNTDEYQLKFSSTPIAEGDKLFLPMTLSVKTDLSRLMVLFEALENMPYMTHVTGVGAKTPDGLSGKGEYNIGLKVYVQNPFSTK